MSDVTEAAKRTTPENILGEDIRVLAEALKVERMERVAKYFGEVVARHPESAELKAASSAMKMFPSNVQQALMYYGTGKPADVRTGDLRMLEAWKALAAGMLALRSWRAKHFGARYYQGPAPGVFRGDDNAVPNQP